MTHADWFDELSEFLRIRSISADPEHAQDVWAAAEWVCQFVRGAGGSGELIDWQGQPLAVCELQASREPARAPTVLCYGHFDVQPPDPLELWDSAPFEPEVRDEYLYGRGVADDKGQLYLLLSAARALAQGGQLPLNVRFICDGEEETGGNSVVEFLQSDDRDAAAAVIFDSLMLGLGLPAFNIATRGIVYVHVQLRTGQRDLHSGLYGGAALNAAHALIETLRAVLPIDGRLADSLRAGLQPPGVQERESWRELPSGAEELRSRGARPADARAADEFYPRTLAEPALDVNGLATGSPEAVKTIVPVQASANVSIRVAPGQDPGEVASALERLLLDAAPAGAELDVQPRATVPPSVTSPSAEAVQLGLDAFERVMGVRPALVRSGGTLPIASALTAKGVATIISGFALPDANIHSPNERLLAEYVPLGIATAGELFRRLGSL